MLKISQLLKIIDLFFCGPWYLALTQATQRGYNSWLLVAPQPCPAVHPQQ